MASVRDVLKIKGDQVFSIEATPSMNEALSLMADENIGALLVYEAEELVGIVSERDYARKGFRHEKPAAKIAVRDVMSRTLIEVTPDTSVTTCMRLMTDHRVRHLPVMAEGRVAGVISIGDVVSEVIREHELMIKQLEEYIVGLR